MIFQIFQTGLPVMQRALCQGVDVEDMGAKLIDAVLASDSARVKELLDIARNAIYRGFPDDPLFTVFTPFTPSECIYSGWAKHYYTVGTSFYAHEHSNSLHSVS